MNENELKALVAKNLILYRKANHWTQLELAEKINYSDKSVSKWERGESIPDLLIMHQLSQLYGIKIDDLLKDKKQPIKPKRQRNKFLIPLMAATSVYAIATIVFVFLGIFAPDLTNSWLAFIYAIPVSLVVFTIFSKIWGNRFMVFIFASAFLWTTALAILLSFHHPKIWLFFIAAIPFQVLCILWLTLKPKKNEKSDS
jgi:transcriptional regulator with XRE-family HTH domain